MCYKTLRTDRTDFVREFWMHFECIIIFIIINVLQYRLFLSHFNRWCMCNVQHTLCMYVCAILWIIWFCCWMHSALLSSHSFQICSHMVWKGKTLKQMMSDSSCLRKIVSQVQDAWTFERFNIEHSNNGNYGIQPFS